jgi:hypothetical protein
MTHSFNVEVAQRFGVEKAIVIEHIEFHSQANADDGRYQKDGKSYGALPKRVVETRYPYLKYNSVRKWLKELEQDGILESIQPELKNWKQQKFYRVTIDLRDHVVDLSDHSSYNIQSKYNYIQFVDLWNELFNTKARITDGKRAQIRTRLKTFTEEEIKKALHNRSKSAKLLSPTNWDAFWRNDEYVESWLNKGEKKQQQIESWKL